jgi:hypothetical protein
MPRIIDSSRYQTHLRRWTELFGPEQILVILLEDISSSPGSVLERAYQFIGIDKLPTPAQAWEQVNGAALPASPALASIITRGAYWLRDRRLYGPLEFAKKLGLKRIYSGSQDPLPTLEPVIRQELIDELAPDISYVEKMLGRPLPKWRQVSGSNRDAESAIGRV